MDLRDFVKLRKDDLGTKRGLYIVSPSGYTAPYDQYYRCGVAGSGMMGSDTDLAYGSGARAGSFVGRFSMYLANWIAGGKLWALLTLESRLKHLAGSERRIVVSHRHLQDARESYAHKTISLTRYREHLFHELLDAAPGVSRVLGPKSEWFHSANVQTLIECLRKTGGLELITFDSQGIATREKAPVNTQPLSEEYVRQRHSPRVAFLTREGKKVMRRGGAEAAALTAAIARDARRMDAPISARTRSGGAHTIA